MHSFLIDTHFCCVCCFYYHNNNYNDERCIYLVLMWNMYIESDSSKGRAKEMCCYRYIGVHIALSEQSLWHYCIHMWIS